jgi:hypothetical protein
MLIISIEKKSSAGGGYQKLKILANAQGFKAIL